MPAIHQFVAGFSNGDAISNEARVLQKLFHSWGRESEIFCEQKRVLPELRSQARDVTKAHEAVRPGDIVILHLSIGSLVNNLFALLPCKKAIIYHNITPPHFFQGLQEEIVHHLKTGLEQARALAGTADVVMAVSKFNAAELEAMGYRGVQVLPLFLDREHWTVPPGRRVMGLYDDDKVNVLFVGRGAPNKRIEDLLFAFYYFQKYIQPESRLIHVGSYAGIERYHALLRAKCVELKLNNVHFQGSVRQDELNAYYKLADIFLCMSEHEGFCIPLLEAMAHRVPVLAYAAGAVPETLDGAGALFREKRFDLVAEMMNRVASDEKLRASMLKTQDERLARYTQLDLPDTLKRYLSPLL